MMLLSFLLMAMVCMPVYASIESYSVAVNAEAQAEAEPLSKAEKQLVAKEAKQVDAATKKNFNRLAKAWRKQIASTPEAIVSSSTQRYTTLPAFAELQAMGKQILPLVVKELLDEDQYFFLTLYDALQADDTLKCKETGSEQEKTLKTIRLWMNGLRK